MVERPTEFCYHNIELYKSESLGSGSYGGVCKAKCDGLQCAAKIMHPTLFDLRDPGTGSYLRKFREECHLLSLARHPNVVQYLGTYTDPVTRLPVLLMELCDESLTAFLERSPGPLSYHIQVNIAHDVALALVYLHSNGLIHRDLTGNNVLMIAGPRAKITDFGMSKLASVNPRMTALTLCPGNVLYMSPEALDEAKSYTAKLDIFSFGVIVIQILTRKFPNPTDRFRIVRSEQREDEDDDEESEVRKVVPETERRQAHLNLIAATHSLKPVVLQCLKKKESLRPSALQLGERLSALKGSSQYTESRQQAESNSEVEQLQLQLRGQRILTDAKTKEAEEYQEQIAQLGNAIEDRDRQLLEQQYSLVDNICQFQEKEQQLQAQNVQLQLKQDTISSRDETIEMNQRELNDTQEKLQGSEQLVAAFQESLQQKDQTITDLQQTLSDREQKIEQLQEQGDRASRDQPPQQPVTKPQTTVEAPLAMVRGAAVMHGDTAYFAPADSNEIYSYQNILEKGCWSQLPDNYFENYGLVIISGYLTSIGGWNNGSTATLLSLIREDKRKIWSAIFPPMFTPRSDAACITTESDLVVVGGIGKFFENVDTVEVMNIDSEQWSTVCSIPQRCSTLSVTICKDMLYLTGAKRSYSYAKSVFACSVPDLLRSIGKLSPSYNVWKEIRNLPVAESTLVSVDSHLLAVGGTDDSFNRTSDIFRYDSFSDSWYVKCQMKNKRSYCLAVPLPETYHFVVVGGYTGKAEYTGTNKVEIGTFR